MDTTDIILKPLITEKSMKEAGRGKFTFKVLKKADKNMIRRAIEEKFKVNVVSVATSIVKGRSQRFGARRIETALPSWKKAIVQLKPDQKIDLFEVSATQQG